jgi:UPF0489 domain
VHVLDLDLDFFLRATGHELDSSAGRPDAEDYPPWPQVDVDHFLTESCSLSGRRPGFVVDHHNELFYRWGEAIRSGRMTGPLDVVHVDAHADLGLGDASYSYLISELAFERVEERYETLLRRRPATREEMLDLGSYSLTDGNWLMFALACGWLSRLTYVSNSFVETSEGRRPADLMGVLMKDFDPESDQLQVVASRENFVMRGRGHPLAIENRDRPVPFATTEWTEFRPRSPSISYA